MPLYLLLGTLAAILFSVHLRLTVLTAVWIFGFDLGTEHWASVAIFVHSSFSDKIHISVSEGS